MGSYIRVYSRSGIFGLIYQGIQQEKIIWAQILGYTEGADYLGSDNRVFSRSRRFGPS